MSRPSTFHISTLFAAIALCAPASAFAQQPTAAPNRLVIASDQVPAGFHVSSSSPAPPRPAQIRLHPRPAPLTGEQLNSAVAKYGLHPVGLHLLVPPNITYQLEVFDQSTGAEVNTTSVESTVFYTSGNQSMGYIQITFNVNPGIQNLLDCSLGADGSFKVFTSMTGVPNAEGNISSFNQHLMIPFSTTPSNTKSAQAIIYFDNIEFDGCTLDSVSK